MGEESDVLILGILTAGLILMVNLLDILSSIQVLKLETMSIFVREPTQNYWLPQALFELRDEMEKDKVKDKAKEALPLEHLLSTLLEATKVSAKQELAASENATREMNWTKEELAEAEASLTTREAPLRQHKVPSRIRI